MVLRVVPYTAAARRRRRLPARHRPRRSRPPASPSTPAPDSPYGPTPPADATAPAPAATPPRRGPGWGGVGALVVLGMVLSSGATLGGVVAYDQLLDAEPQVSAQPAPETSSE